MSAPKRYHPLLVALHWISAILIIFMLLVGTFLLKRTPNDLEKIPSLAVHMVAGLAILALTTVRLVVRLTTKRPAPVKTGSPLLDRLAEVIHGLLYLAAFGMGLSGVGIAIQSGLFATVFAGSGSLPVDFYDYPPRLGHGFLATAIFILIGLHIGAALFHEVIRKDRLMRRMWFGKR